MKTFDQWGQDMDDENSIHEFGGQEELQGEVVVIDEQCGVEEGGQVQQGVYVLHLN